MGLAILAGLYFEVCNGRRNVAWASRPWSLRHGQDARATTLPLWRRVVLTSLPASVFLSSNPQAAYAGTPVYDPVFYYYHPDHLGSSQLMTDRDGDVVQQYGYTPFGKENYKNNTLAFPVSSRYTGQTLDEETGLYYYGARYYDPELARFIQADSTVPDPEFSQAYNRYAYVYNNPLKFSDPTGQEPFTIASLIVASLISGSVSATVSAIMGGDPLMGFIAGAIGGAFGYVGGCLNLGPVGMGLMGAAGGALGALATGGDPLMGAISAGITSGIMAGMRFSPVTSLNELFTEQALRQIAITTVVGAAIGGVTAEAFGGDFADGAAAGAAGAAAGFVVGVLIAFELVPHVQEMFGWGVNGTRIDWASYGPPPAQPDLTHWGYEKADDAAKAALALARSSTDKVADLARQMEHGGYIYEYKGRYGFTKPVCGGTTSMPPEAMAAARKTVPNGAKIVGDYHSHTYRPTTAYTSSYRFSGVDFRGNRGTGDSHLLFS